MLLPTMLYILIKASLYVYVCLCYTCSVYINIKTHGSESRGQGGSSKRRPDGLETHTREYFTGTRVVKFDHFYAQGVSISAIYTRGCTARADGV